MLVTAVLSVEVEVEIDDKFKALDNPAIKKGYFSDPMCDECKWEAWSKIRDLYPELTELTVREVYSSENFHTLYEEI